MNAFIGNTILCFLGAAIPIFIRAWNHAGNLFTLRIFIVDNGLRFGLLGAVLVIVNVIIYFQPEFLESLRSMGLVIPAVASAAIGLALSGLMIKTIPTLARAMSEGKE